MILARLVNGDFMTEGLVQVEVGEAVSGDEFYEIQYETPGYVQQRGRSKTFVAASVYCVACSTLTEHDARTGTVREKWVTTQDDYSWNVQYQRDKETGESFGVCQNCHHRLAETTATQLVLRDESSQSKRASGEDHEVEYEWIGEAEYDGGYFWMTTDDRKELFQTITRIRKENLKLAPAVLVGGSGYALDIAAFIRVIKECPDKDGMHGVPRQCWRSL